MIDLRSDTVTKPTPEMLQAMTNAPLGDDVLGDDSATRELEAKCAELTGKEASIFVPSGTMGNQIALATHCKPGDLVILEAGSHIIHYEGGGPGIIAGVVTKTLLTEDGVMTPQQICESITVQSDHTPGTSLICYENTHNRAGGSVIPLAVAQEYRTLADTHACMIHLDGARIVNAAAALGCPVSEACRAADSVMMCLSKGLGAPVGSILAGSRDFIQKAKYWRKRLGGGMRQSGVLAACGLVALRDILPQIPLDHERAKRVAKGLSGIPGIHVEPDKTVTNMVMVHTTRPAAEWQTALRNHGVAALLPASNRMRLVFHHQITDTMVPKIIDALAAVSGEFGA